jgi:hypothetical protein
MYLAAISTYCRYLIDEQAREQRLHVRPGPSLDGHGGLSDAENGRVVGDSWSAKPSLSRSSIAATRARTSGPGTSTRFRDPHSPHSNVIQ